MEYLSCPLANKPKTFTLIMRYIPTQRRHGKSLTDEHSASCDEIRLRLLWAENSRILYS